MYARTGEEDGRNQHQKGQKLERLGRLVTHEVLTAGIVQQHA